MVNYYNNNFTRRYQSNFIKFLENNFVMKNNKFNSSNKYNFHILSNFKNHRK